MKEIYEAGIDSVKIEGRMKSLYYTANVTRTYKHAINNLKTGIQLSEKIESELDKVSHRVYTEGFFDKFDSMSTQYHQSSSYIRKYQFLGEIVNVKNHTAFINVRAKFSIGDSIEFIFPNIEDDFTVEPENIFDTDDIPLEFTKPNTIVKIPIEKKIPDYGILRKKIEKEQ